MRRWYRIVPFYVKARVTARIALVVLQATSKVESVGKDVALHEVIRIGTRVGALLGVVYIGAHVVALHGGIHIARTFDSLILVHR